MRRLGSFLVAGGKRNRVRSCHIAPPLELNRYQQKPQELHVPLEVYMYVYHIAIYPLLIVYIAMQNIIWVDVKIMVPFWVTIIIRHLIFRVPKKGP